MCVTIVFFQALDTPQKHSQVLIDMCPRCAWGLNLESISNFFTRQLQSLSRCTALVRRQGRAVITASLCRGRPQMRASRFFFPFSSTIDDRFLCHFGLRLSWCACLFFFFFLISDRRLMTPPWSSRLLRLFCFSLRHLAPPDDPRVWPGRGADMTRARGGFRGWRSTPTAKSRRRCWQA